MMGAGELPAFASLAANGSYRRLKTINPPQSPVVWTTIATGAKPAEHGIFDFLHSDPKTCLPYLSILRREGPRFKPPYSVKTFWEKASDWGIPSTVIRWPVTFPPKPIKGKILAGLGVPDIRGTLGTYSFFTTDAGIAPSDKKGRIVQVQIKNNRIVTELAGPIGQTSKGQKDITLPLVIDVSPEGITCSLGSARISLKEGQWSDWIQLKFSLGLLTSVKGLCKLYLKSLAPEFALYVTPIHIDPESYMFPISSPYDYAQDLLLDVGSPFATLGMPEEANSLNDEVIDEEAFLLHADVLMQEREKMFMRALSKFQEGILACVFDTTDRVQHMFWRHTDPGHPAYNEQMAAKYGHVISDYYRRMDKIVSSMMQKISDDTVVLICSDHGFSSLKKEFHLNSWLVQNGFMTLADGQTECRGLFSAVQWSGTKAYAVGFNSIYLNRAGREKQGIVTPEAEETIKKELAEKLSSVWDNDTKVVNNVYKIREIYGPAQTHNEPDLIVGYSQNYRTSSSSAIGQIKAGPLIETNQKRWSGDHCSEAEAVPGIFFSSQKEWPSGVSVLDIAPFIEGYLKP